MSKYKSIVISGEIGSGTTTASQNIAKKLNFKVISAGDFFRHYSLKNNIPLFAKDKIPDELDENADRELTKLASQGNIVIDSHYAGYFNKDKDDILKVLLICKKQERIKRVATRVHTHNETAEDIKKRQEGLDNKFRKLYADENFLNPKNFDLKINNTNLPQEEVTEKIHKKFKEN